MVVITRVDVCHIPVRCRLMSSAPVLIGMLFISAIQIGPVTLPSFLALADEHMHFAGFFPKHQGVLA